MERERWRRAEEVFHSALNLAPEARPAFLDEACGADATLRELVETLVSRDRVAARFLEEPPLPLTAPGAGPSLLGQQIGPYRILSLLGAGGMGEVYRAHDTRLDRDVALKTVPPEFARDPSKAERLRHEARILASINHPNIGAIYGLEESEGVDFLVLELVEGQAPRGPLSLVEALDCASQVADALDAAHREGIVHRDLKPANIKRGVNGQVKVLDFGVAKAASTKVLRAREEDTLRTGTAGGRIVGTPGYMSPEQARGAEVDCRTDIWAFGCLLYELLTGRRAFPGDSSSGAIVAVLEQQPDWQSLPPGVPGRVRQLLKRCLDKDPAGRPSSMGEVRATLLTARRRALTRRLVAERLRNPLIAVPSVLLLVAASAGGAVLYRREARRRWIGQQAAEITRLLSAGDFLPAFRLLRHAERVVPGDDALRRLHAGLGMPLTVVTTPPGAEVFATGYTPGDEEWLRLGVTPLTTRDLPFGLFRVRLVKPGYRDILGTIEVHGGSGVLFDLDADAAIPPEMVRVPGSEVLVPFLGRAPVGSFLIDRYETTNRQFKQFVDAGGYGRREYWTEPFVSDGRDVTWDEAMRTFIDSSGQPGPSTWARGTYSAGHDDDPVGGISWYEAAAYARFAGKQLPTVFHWQAAAAPGWHVEIARLSNFDGVGPARVGKYPGLGAFGTYDMAGNVREWCWNTIEGKRYARGGSWSDPLTLFAGRQVIEPWTRSAENGVRCARYDGAASEAALEPIRPPTVVPEQREPVSDQVFATYRSLYAYDPVPLDARVEGTDRDTADWKREVVSFASPYGGERVVAYLYLPKRVSPPYQAVLYANPGMAFRLSSVEGPEERMYDFVVRSGRAFMHPALKGYYQRRYPSVAEGPHAERDRRVLESKEFRRCLDYLATRGDIDHARLGVFGYSRGAINLPVLAVGEDRLKAAVLVSVGLPDASLLPESDPLNFASRFRMPTLMINGKWDFGLPVESSQLPLFRLLPMPEPDKKLVSFEGSHGDLLFFYRLIVDETSAWLDRHLGRPQ